jgi:hypothetical protein
MSICLRTRNSPFVLYVIIQMIASEPAAYYPGLRVILPACGLYCRHIAQRIEGRTRCQGDAQVTASSGYRSQALVVFSQYR